MTNHPSPTAARSSKFTKTRWQGKEHLLWKRVPWNPGTEASLRTVQRSKAKRCEAGPVSPCNLGKGTNASLRTGEVRQVQERSKEARPNQQARQTHGRCIQGVKVDCCNIMVKQRRKERKSERPFEVLHGPTISSGKYEHSPRVGVAVLFSEGRRST